MIDDLVSLIDMAPTFLDLAGSQTPNDLDCHSVIRACRSESADQPNWVVVEYYSNFANTGIFMLRKGNWNYIANSGNEAQLFNVDADPWELDNLVMTNAHLADNMDALCRSICDVRAVDASAMAYDRASFHHWR